MILWTKQIIIGSEIILVLLWILIHHTSICQAQSVNLKQGIQELANNLAISVPEGEKLTIAVTDFVDSQGQTRELGLFIAERLTTQLSQFPRFQVIERRRLTPLLTELNFSASDLVDPTKAKEFGKMLGVEAIVVGTITDLASTVDVDARIIEVETSIILPGTFVNISKDPDVIRMMETEHRPTFKPESISPATVSKSDKRSIEFENLNITLDSLQVLSDNSIIVTIKFLNRSEKELLVALDADSWGKINSDNIYVTDDLGNKYSFKGSNSIGPAHFINIKRGSSGWLTCPPGAEVTASITFEPPRNIEKRGTRFSTSIPIYIGTYYIDEHDYTRVTEDVNYNIRFNDISFDD